MSFRHLCGALLLVSVGAVNAFAQSAPHLARNVELAGFTGTTFSAAATRLLAGTNLAVGINKYLLPYVEYSYLPGFAASSETEEGSFGGTGENFRLFFPAVNRHEVHGGLHVRLPIRESRVVPYVVGGVGAIHSPGATITARFNVPGSTEEFVEDFRAEASTTWAVNGGAGLRWYTTQRFGFRAEVKGYHTGLARNATFGKITAGLFFQFR